MTDTRLGKDQAISLLEKLSTDDSFRASYEKSPPAALRAFGIPEQMINSLSSESLAPIKLTSKDAFHEALMQVRKDTADVFLCLRVPTVRLNDDDASDARKSSAAISFAGS